MGATIAQEWSSEHEVLTEQPLTSQSTLAEEVSKIVLDLLVGDPSPCYHETMPQLDHLCAVTNSLVDSFLHDNRINATDPRLPRQISFGGDQGSFTISQARLAVDWLDGLHELFVKPKKKKDSTRIDDAKRTIRELIHVVEESKAMQDSKVFAGLAGAAISLKAMPPKLTPLIKSVMNSIKVNK
jgi:TATA-binding protein-associated factor